jgi:hypothetical protein
MEANGPSSAAAGIVAHISSVAATAPTHSSASTAAGSGSVSDWQSVAGSGLAGRPLRFGPGSVAASAVAALVTEAEAKPGPRVALVFGPPQMGASDAPATAAKSDADNLLSDLLRTLRLSKGQVS